MKNRAVVIELRSSTDKLSDLQQKMLDYLDCGVKLGWLINPQDKQVEIYRRRPRADMRSGIPSDERRLSSDGDKGTRLKGANKEILDNPVSLLGEDVLPGLIVDLTSIL